MKVLTLIGSSRKKGNTAALTGALESELKQSKVAGRKFKKILLAEYTIEPCRGCLKCKSKGHCVVSDDFSKISTQLLRSDVIILGSPVYFSDVSGQVKNLMDRTISLWHTRQLKGKKIILLATCAESGTRQALETMKNWSLAHEIQVVSTIEGKSENKGDVLTNEDVKGAIKSSAEALTNLFSTHSEPKPTVTV